MNKINGLDLKRMLQSAGNHLANNRKKIDALNVFPVPDGDTGTNMSMSFTSGVNNAISTYSDNLAEVARALSKGLLMGARGNSGVITSQIFRGFYNHLENKSEADVNDLAYAFLEGYKAAYKAIMKPVEGTILTVIREASENALKRIDEAKLINEYFEILIEEAKNSLNRTPELLPVLKEVGVVDSGGSGLVVILEGLYEGLKGNIIALNDNQALEDDSAALNVENDEFGYCTEFILRLNDDFIKIFDEQKLRKSLSKIGDSLVVVQDDDLVKVHIHTLRPGDALNIGQRVGEFIKLKIENMQEQHNQIVHDSLSQTNMEINSLPKTKYAVIAVSVGEGLNKLFKEYRTDHIISGGQTMNPSTQDFINCIRKTNANHVIILPNNSNIILAANQAKEVLKEEYDISVVESKSLQAGLSAIAMFDPEASLETNLENMNSELKHVKAASVTFAIKDTSFEGVSVKENDHIAMADKKIIASGKDRLAVMKQLIDYYADEDGYELLNLFIGEEGNMDEALLIKEYIEKHTDFEVEILEGKQPVYSYLIAIE